MPQHDYIRYYHVLAMLAEDYYPAKVAEVLKISRQAASKACKILEKWGFVRALKGYPTFYELTAKGKLARVRGYIDVNLVSLGQTDAAPPITPPNRWHNIGAELTIVRGNDRPIPGAEKIRMKNWAKYVAHLSSPDGPVTLEKNTKVVNIYIPEIQGPPERATHAIWRAAYFAAVYLARHGIITSYPDWKPYRNEVAGEVNDPTGKNKMRKAARRYLGRKAAGTDYRPTAQQAWAGIDSSLGKGHPEVETNDARWRQEFLAMPGIVAEQVGIMQKVTEQLAVHIPAVQLLGENAGRSAEATTCLAKATDRHAESTERLISIVERLERRLHDDC